jgi:hypothetical protein
MLEIRGIGLRDGGLVFKKVVDQLEPVPALTN